MYYKEINYLLGVNRRLSLDEIDSSFEKVIFEIKCLYKSILQTPYLDDLRQGGGPIDEIKGIYGA